MGAQCIHVGDLRLSAHGVFQRDIMDTTSEVRRGLQEYLHSVDVIIYTLYMTSTYIIINQTTVSE